MPDPGPEPGRRPGHQRRPLDRATTSGPSTSPTTRTPRPRSATDFERQVPGVPLVVVESPYRALVGPLLAYLDVLDARLAAGQAGADHVRGHPRVRRPQLVGADPLQPGRQAAADGPARPAAHGRRRRPVPARGSGPVRGGARRRPRPTAEPPDGRADRTDAADRRPRRWYRDRPCQIPTTPAFRRAVVALNGGPSDARIVRLVAEQARHDQGRARRRPRRRDRLDAAARRRHRRPVRGGPARPRHRRGGRRGLRR